MRSDDRALLDFLCFAAPRAGELDRMFRLRGSWGRVIDSLRHRGLVALDSLEPSPSAMADFQERHPRAANDAAPAKRAYRKRDWTDEELRAMAIAYDRGISVTDLAHALGRNFHAVAKHASNQGFRFGLRPRRVTPPTLAEILELEEAETPPPPAPLKPARGGKRPPVPWPSGRKRLFLETLKRTGRIDAALVAIGFKTSSRKAAYREKHRDNAFSLAWDQALAASPYRPGPKPKSPPRAAPRVRAWARPERQDAFVAALRATGQVKAALASLGLTVAGSVKAVHGERRADADFDRRCTEALRDWSDERAAAKAVAAFARALGRRLARSARKASAPAERSKVPLWASQERQDAFVAALRRLGTVTDALVSIGLSAGSNGAYGKQRSVDPAFAARCDEAIRAGRAVRGVRPRRDRHQPKPRPVAQEFERQPARRPIGEDGIDWEAARRMNRLRKSGQTFMERQGGAPVKTIKAGGAAAFFMARAAAETQAAQSRAVDPVEQAKLMLQRRGRIVYRASVKGGPEDRWFVSGLGQEVTAEQLIAEAERIAA